MNKTAFQCHEWAEILGRSIGSEPLIKTLTQAAKEIERLEREASTQRDAATTKVDGKTRRQG
jgi:hypothetical protein